MNHTCHAEGCSLPVPPRMFACKRHWFMVSKWLRDALEAAYRPGQEDDKQPSPWYLLMQTRCRLEIARREFKAAALTREMGTRIRNALHPDSVERDWDDEALITQFDSGFRPGFRPRPRETWESVGEHPTDFPEDLSESEFFGTAHLPGDR